MHRRQLGESGIEVSIIALGTWAMGNRPETWGKVDDNESIAAINEAIQRGINLIDTAPIYGLGHAEEIVGKAIRGRRDQVVIATKCGLTNDGPREGDTRRDLRFDTVIAEWASACRRLQTDYIDIYQCHWPDPETPIEETLRAMTRLREQGKIRAIGLCNYGCQGISAAREVGVVHCVQPPLSLLERRATEELLPYCQEYNLGVLTYGTLAKGLLSGKFTPQSEIDGVRAEDPNFRGDRYRANLELVDRLAALAAECGKSVGQLAVNWALNYPGVTSAIVGAKRPSQVAEIADAAGWQLPADHADRLRAMLETP